MKPILFIVGGSSTALEIREVVDLYYVDKYSFVYNVIADNEDSLLDAVIKDSELLNKLKGLDDIRFILGFTNFKLREKISKLFYEFNGLLENVIHPQAYISPSAKIGEGNYIAANAVISSNAVIGNSNLINYNVTIGHDALTGNDCFFNPGTRISGNVKIGDKCLFGANSFVYQTLEIESDCQIDALCYIDRKIEYGSICSSNYGNLRIYKKRF